MSNENMMPARIEQSWLQGKKLQKLLSVLNEGDAVTRIVGGAVRNALLGQGISDIDLATTLVPRNVVERSQRAGFKTVPTGLAHGTVTVVVDGDAFEVTTLRQDVETDGRHARVVYGIDWEADAQRRDLTMNALYLDGDGTVHDPLAGYADVASRNVRFIGEAEQRIREDFLRILRFFRFFAWYGAFRPDATGLKACAKLKDGMAELSAERIWQELVKLLSAPDPSRAILWMRQTGVLSKVLPESEKWGIDAIHGLMRAEDRYDWEPDAVRRLMSIIPPSETVVQKLSERLKLPKVIQQRLLNWANCPSPPADLEQSGFHQFLYWRSVGACEDVLKLAIARSEKDLDSAVQQLEWLETWERPRFPLKGSDLIGAGMEPGTEVSERLKELERQWVESNFQYSTDELLSHHG